MSKTTAAMKQLQVKYSLFPKIPDSNVSFHATNSAVFFLFFVFGGRQNKTPIRQRQTGPDRSSRSELSVASPAEARNHDLLHMHSLPRLMHKLWLDPQACVCIYVHLNSLLKSRFLMSTVSQPPFLSWENLLEIFGNGAYFQWPSYFFLFVSFVVDPILPTSLTMLSYTHAHSPPLYIITYERSRWDLLHNKRPSTPEKRRKKEKR